MRTGPCDTIMLGKRGKGEGLAKLVAEISSWQPSVQDALEKQNVRDVE